MKSIKIKDERSMVLRHAEKSDGKALVDFCNTISGETDFLSYGVNEFLCTVEEEENLIEKYIAQDNSIYMLAEVDGNIAGMIFYSGGTRKRLRHTGEFGIAVAKAYWGLGIGRTMMEALIEWAKQSKIIRKINLRVRTDNEKAIRLYKSLGFTVEGTITRESIINGVFYDFHYMGLPID